MVDAERSLLYMGIGFLSALFIMKSVRALRPASAVSMNSAYRSGCTSCLNNELKKEIHAY